MTFETVGALVYDASADELQPLPVSVPLMERETDGLRVELHHWNGITGIVVRDHDQEPIVQSVPADKAMDAFWHPYCYLPAC